jgi:hypothetical protein
MEYYQVSRAKAEEYLNIISENDIAILRKKMNKGGVK